MGVKSKPVVALVHSGQVAGSDVESWFGYTLLLVTFGYVLELSIRRLLFVYTRLPQKGEIVICIY